MIHQRVYFFSLVFWLSPSVLKKNLRFLWLLQQSFFSVNSAFYCCPCCLKGDNFDGIDSDAVFGANDAGALF